MEKWKIMERWRNLKDEKSRWENDKRIYGNCYQCSATQLMLYDLGVGNYSNINESNFIDEIDELWFGDYAGWFKIVEFWGDTIIWHGNYFKLHLKVIHGY